jgi:acyl-[acyl-carrier-protein]-phospholipid O-acyltransferase/long-chain-fatty-acid--[acyl-carrier-protein] ligase
MEHRRKTSSFGWLNATQFLGALNDNIFKLLIIIFLIGDKGIEAANSVTTTAGAVFVVPFLLFSALAGKVSDKFSKRDIVIWVKIAEAAIMALGCVAFWVGNQTLLYGILFLMAAQSAFFAPSKYGIVPELVGKEELSKANGMLEACTYLAIIIGTALGPIMAQVIGKNYILLGAICILVAGIGLVTSLKIERTKAFGNDIKPNIFFCKRDMGYTCKDKRQQRPHDGSDRIGILPFDRRIHIHQPDPLRNLTSRS